MRVNIKLSCYCEIVYAEEKIIWSKGNVGGRKGGDVMKNKERRHRKQKRKTNEGMCYLQRGPQPGRTSTWEDLRNMNACVPPPEIPYNWSGCSLSIRILKNFPDDSNVQPK